MKKRERRSKKKMMQKNRKTKIVLFGALIGLIISSIALFIGRNVFLSVAILVLTPILFFLYFYFKLQLEKSMRIKKMEEIFPDFLQLMSSNLRAGMTIDKSMLLSVRREFHPLAEEILKAGKDLATGKDVEGALLDMSKRIGSEKIHKTILLIISGVRAGGNIATLLEETSVNMRERRFVEKKAASSVLMYVIFIFIAVSVGAPFLFSLSSILIEILTELLSGIPSVEGVDIPFTLSAISISPVFIVYFALAFIIVTDVLASLVLGLVSKGEEKEGLKYLLPLLAISLVIFFVVRITLSGFVGDLLIGGL